MKLNIKSRKGFTLIELLVVIGILAVLAAIAIPSVAGLIDRANVSADNTNANEMTNAMERFVSEYELFCQDIASGTFDVNNMDAAQGRVYNVTGATTRKDITDLESENGLNGLCIDKDTKLPTNVDTAEKIIDNYIKTSSATYDPKQSDMSYWYSPDCGVVVTATSDSQIDDLNKLVTSGKDVSGNNLDEINVNWINLTTDRFDIDMNTVDVNELKNNSWNTVAEIIRHGKISQTNWKVGDISPSFTINGQTYKAIIIGINHDGNNTVTFQLSSPLSDSLSINSTATNNGGWKDSEIRNTLNTTIYNSFSNDVKQYIRCVNKMSNNKGYNAKQNLVTPTKDYLFLLSQSEVGIDSSTCSHGGYSLVEGKQYSFFTNDNSRVKPSVSGWWLRSPYTGQGKTFHFINQIGKCSAVHADAKHSTIPAFVIG